MGVQLNETCVRLTGTETNCRMEMALQLHHLLIDVMFGHVCRFLDQYYKQFEDRTEKVQMDQMAQESVSR